VDIKEFFEMIRNGGNPELLDLAKESQYRFQVISLSAPIATTAGTVVEGSVQLDRDFNKVIGIGFFQITDGDLINNYSVGARTNRQTWIDPINANAWKAEENVGPQDKYYKVNIPYGSGDTFYGRIIPGGTVATDALAGQMVLILKRDMTELPK
jgi:hypothetical protein